MKTILYFINFAMYIAVRQQRCSALNGEWTSVVSACIRGHNNVVTHSTSVQACQELCEQQDNFRCLSIDFHSNGGNCHLSRYNRNSVPSTDDFTQPCYLDGWLYAEREDLDFPWSEVVHGCIRGNNRRDYSTSSMEACQLRCERETSFPCLSVDFKDGQCLLSDFNRESVRPLSDYTQPCYIEGFQYSERTDKKYFWTETASACIRGNNNEHHNNIDSLEACKDLCYQENTFACLSVDYHPTHANKPCHLSSFNRNSVQPSGDFTQPCYLDGWLYAERVNVGQWIPVIERACIRGHNEWDADTEDFESCKILCSQKSNCCSIDYNRETKRCLMTSHTRASVTDSTFLSPCSGYSYSERTDLRCVTS